MLVCRLSGDNQRRRRLDTLEGDSKVLEDISQDSRSRAPNRSTRRERQVGKEVLALGPLFCEVGNEASRFLRAKMKGTGRNQGSNNSKIHRPTLRAQLRLATDSAILSSPGRGSKK